MKKCIGFLATAMAVIFLAGSAQAAHVSNFNITQADFSLSGFSSGGLPTSGPDLLSISNVTGSYTLDIPPVGGPWDVYVVGSLEADFDNDGTWDDFAFDEYVGNYSSPGPSTSWGPGTIPFTVDLDLGYDVDLDGGYPAGSFGTNANANLTLSGNGTVMYFLNTYLTNLDNNSGGGDGIIDGWIRGDITVTAVPIPSAVLLLGTGLIGLMGIRRKFRT